MWTYIQAVSPGEVITEFRPRFEQKPNPKEAIDSVYKQFDFEVSYSLSTDVYRDPPIMPA